jgi:hypothetical protein
MKIHLLFIYVFATEKVVAKMATFEIEKKRTNPTVGYVMRWIAKCSHLQATLSVANMYVRGEH